MEDYQLRLIEMRQIELARDYAECSGGPLRFSFLPMLLTVAAILWVTPWG